MAKKSTGYAVIDLNGYPKMDTVASTERSAKVNGLVILCGVKVTRQWSNERISETWEQRKGHYYVAPVLVEVDRRG